MPTYLPAWVSCLDSLSWGDDLMSTQKTRVEQILDLLVDEIADRISARSTATPVQAVQEQVLPAKTMERAVADQEAMEGAAVADAVEAETEGQEREVTGEPVLRSVPSHATGLMRRMAIWLLLAIILINVPINRHGTTLATVMPDTASLVIRNGLVVKEEDRDEIYVYQDGAFRWISSLDAFEHYGYTWEDVHIVPDGYLERYAIGSPIHVLLKCESSPHIYRLEGGKKRWIRDIDTFVAEGHVWEDVRFISCADLAALPDGETIPPDSGSPPQP